MTEDTQVIGAGEVGALSQAAGGGQVVSWPEAIQTGRPMLPGWIAQYDPDQDAWFSVNPETGETLPILGLDTLRDEYGIDFDLWPVEAVIGDEIAFIRFRGSMPSKFKEGDVYYIVEIGLYGEVGTHSLAVGGVLADQLVRMARVMPFVGTIGEKQGGNGFRYYTLSTGDKAALLERRKTARAKLTMLKAADPQAEGRANQEAMTAGKKG